MNYSDGREIRLNDSVGYDPLDGSPIERVGEVTLLILPETDTAHDYQCSETGGAIIKFTDGELELWTSIDEHLVLLQRK